MAKNLRKVNGHRRRTVVARVMARDELCWLCKAPVDKTLRGTIHPMAPEVHEIIPVSRGGSPYLLSNTTLCHRRCNSWIGARTPDEIRTRVPKRGGQPQPVITSQSW